MKKSSFIFQFVAISKNVNIWHQALKIKFDCLDKYLLSLIQKQPVIYLQKSNI